MANIANSTDPKVIAGVLWDERDSYFALMEYGCEFETKEVLEQNVPHEMKQGNFTNLREARRWYKVMNIAQSRR